VRDGVHIPASVVRVVVIVLGLALTALLIRQIPEARRYVKIELM
jgi:hypothetical protein